MKERLIVIVGPTAVGKTLVSIELARYLNSQIISGDSMLVYRGMNIGTAKPTFEEQQGVVHHLIDIRDPQEDYSVVDFQEEAGELIARINRQGRIPILAGGTGLYVRALLEGYKFNGTAADQELRRKLTTLADTHGSDYLHNLLQTLCPEKAAKLHPNDRRRIIRALEVFHTEGEGTSETAACHSGEICYDALVIGLTMNRNDLYDRINKRVDMMVAAGLVAEVQHLTQLGLTPKHQSMQGIGYKEVLQHLSGDIDLPTMTEKIKQVTRNFAKRQLTWYRKMPYIQWVNKDSYDDHQKMMEHIYKKVAGNFGTQ